MKVLLMLALASLLALMAGIGVMYAIGAAQPRTHVVSRTALYPQPPDSVWAVLSDWEHSPSWRKDVQRVERLPDVDGHPVWRQVAGKNAWSLVVTEEIAPLRMVATIADSTPGWGGTWTYRLAPEDGGTRVTVIERGAIENPLFRFLMRYVFGPGSAIDMYLTGLGTRFGVAVKPVDARVEE